MPPTAAPCASPPIHRTDELEVGKALAAGGIMVRDIPTTCTPFPQSHACFTDINNYEISRTEIDIDVDTDNYVAAANVATAIPRML